MTRLNLPVVLALALAGQAVAQTGTPIYVYPPQLQSPTQTPPATPAAPLTMPTSIQYSPVTTSPATSTTSTISTGTVNTSAAPTKTITIPVAGSSSVPVATSQTATVPQPQPQPAPSSSALLPATSRPSRLLWGGLSHTSSANSLGIGASLPVGQFQGFTLIGRGLGEFGSLKATSISERKTYFAVRSDLLAEYALGEGSAVYAGPGLELGQRRALGLTAGYRRTFNQFSSGPIGAFIEGQLERAWTSGGLLGNQGGLRAGVTYRF
ncbi:hypothetical protein [Deinococcus sp.]|uniref:hypothetical protein n=1 Tax=Deinococcus sp. TaxID=47478 RepID=UPI0025BACCC5|nr:hypothetical protein [Deinococcus sp.]